MTDVWKTRCDDNHLGHFLMDYMRQIPHGIHQVDAATGQEETCASVLSRTIRLAQCFGKLGLVPGDTIAVGGRNHLDVHIPFYAGMMCGLPVAGVDPALKGTELKHLLRIVEPKVAFCEFAMLEEYMQATQELNLDTKIITFGGGQNSLPKFMDSQDLPPEEEFKVATFNTDEVYCWLPSTSGSTGLPKIVALTHSHIRQMLDFFKFPAHKTGGIFTSNDITTRHVATFRPLIVERGNGIGLKSGCDDDTQSNVYAEYKSVRRTALNLSTLHWASGYYNALLMPTNHIKVQTSAPVTTEHVIDIINKYKPAGTICTPTFLAPLLHHKTYCDITCFDVIKVAGSKVHSELLTGLKARLRDDTVIMQGYGQTEIGGVVLQSPAEPYGSMGTIDPMFEAKLESPETGKEILEPNITGELLLKGPVMAVVPPEVEEVILLHEGVADVCVTGIPHLEDGEHIVACVVRQQGSQVTAQDIKDLVFEHLSASKHLHGGVVFMDALPTTYSGKVARLEVKKLVLTAQRE